MNEEYTIEDIDSAISYVDNTDMTDKHADVIIDALLFYKEMHFNNG